MQLQQHFKDLTLHPKNANELKGLVLQLAIQGKLTAKWRKENTDVEPATELLKRILKEKENLIKAKKLKSEKPLPPIKEAEVPFRISKTWVWTRLGDIGTTNVGLTYKPAHIDNNGVPVLRSSNIQEGELCLKDLVRVNTNYREKDIIEEGDLLICARNGSRRLVGKCTIIGQIKEVMVFGAFMAIFRSNFNPYLQLFIQSPQYRSKLDGVETTTINQITQGNLKETTVPLPPLKEQKAIVEVVNQLFVEVEQLEQLTVARISLKEDFVTSALKQLTTNNAKKEWAFLQDHFKSVFNETSNIKKLRETVLQLAVQGKLTQAFRESHPELVSGSHHASELLKRIQKEKAQLIKAKKIKKEKPLPPITKDDIPYELPEGWVWCRMVDTFNIGSSKRVFKHDYVDEGVPFFRSKEVGQLGRGEAVTTELFISRELYNEFKENFGISKPGDVLMACIGGSIGNTWLVDDREFYYKDGNLVQIRGVMEIEGDYLMMYLDSSVFYDSALGRVSGSAYNALTIEKIKKSLFPLPCLEEQKAIVQKVNALMGLCDALEQEVQQSQEQIEKLMHSCLREVFINN